MEMGLKTWKAGIEIAAFWVSGEAVVLGCWWSVQSVL